MAAVQFAEVVKSFGTFPVIKGVNIDMKMANSSFLLGLLAAENQPF